MRRHANIIGQNVIKWRYQKDWTQDQLAAKMQLSGYYITRQIIANIESRRSSVSDKRVAYLAEIFDVKAGDLFPRKAVLKNHANSQMKFF
jgi:transcriptional regulator with XRE-family HTH domain